MSLFGKSDKNLPLLTEFYQLEFDPSHLHGSELDQWITRFNRETPWITGIDQIESKEIIQKLYKMALDPLIDLHRVVHSIFDDAADKKKVQRRMLEQFNTIRIQRQPQTLVIGPADDNGFVPLSKIDFITTLSTVVQDRLEIQIIQELSDVLREAQTKNDLFRRCPECHGVFAYGRNDQEYCSNRCRLRRNARASQRRKRASAKVTLCYSSL